VEKLPEEDLEEITHFARDYIEDYNSRDLGVKLDMSRAYLDILQSRLNLLTRNGLVGLTLVIIALSLFLSVRLSLWVSWGIPFSFLAMFMAAYLMGITINMMSLFGMILVIGILVDDGIVIVKLQGACAGCPMSQMTLKMGIEQHLKRQIPEVKEVRNLK